MMSFVPNGRLFLLLGLLSLSAPALALDYPLAYVRYPRVGPTPSVEDPNTPGIDANGYLAGSGWYGNLYDDFSYDKRCYGDPGDSGAPACADDYATPPEPPVPDVRDLYKIGEGGDLVLRFPSGQERVLVDHDESAPSGAAVGSVLDPTVSPDGRWIAYANVENARLDNPYDSAAGVSAIQLYKIDIGNLLTDPEATLPAPVCLTCTVDFERDRFHGYDPQRDDSALDATLRGVAHLSPLWLPDDRIIFTSTMAAEAVSGIPHYYEERVDFFMSTEMEAATQLWIMDSDGSNRHRIGPSTLGRAQHPALLEDGRIVFTSWEMAFRRRLHHGFSLNQIYPDGSGMVQFAGRHQRAANSLHFVSAIPGGQFCATQYYNGERAGFGTLLCFPADPEGLDFTDDGPLAFERFLDQPFASLYQDVVSTTWTRDDLGGTSFYFDTDVLNRQERLGSWYLTPYMPTAGNPTPDWNGRVTQLSPATRNPQTGKQGILIAWSKGGVNTTTGGGPPNESMPRVNSDIFLIEDANAEITDPDTQMVAIVPAASGDAATDQLAQNTYNEMWPKLIAPLSEIFPNGIAIPAASTNNTGEPFGYLQAASIRTRLTQSDCVDHAAGHKFDSSSDCYWLMQGTDAGVVGDDDIVGIRVLAVVPEGLSKGFEPQFPSDSDYQYYNKGWYSPVLDRVYILGEFSTLKRDASGALLTNSQDLGTNATIQPDTSYIARLPAWVPIFQQGLDRNGMATSTESTWHHVAPGERKTCVGCHMKTQATPVFADSQAGKNSDLYEVDLALATPLFTGEVDARSDPIVDENPQHMVGVEWTRDVGPLLKTHCSACHRSDNLASVGNLLLDDSIDSYKMLALPETDGSSTIVPQVSKWVRAMQARQSILAWYLYGKRLDGRLDVGDPTARGGSDWTFNPTAVATNHSDAAIAAASSDGTVLSHAEKLTIARWIDIGVPIDLTAFYQAQDPQSAAWKTRRNYLTDDLPPVVTMAGIPQPNPICRVETITVGFWDNDAIDPASLTITLDGGNNLATPPAADAVTQSLTLSLYSGIHAIRVTVKDRTGNKTDEQWDMKIDPSTCPVEDSTPEDTGDTGNNEADTTSGNTDGDTTDLGATSGSGASDTGNTSDTPDAPTEPDSISTDDETPETSDDTPDNSQPADTAPLSGSAKGGCSLTTSAR